MDSVREFLLSYSPEDRNMVLFLLTLFTSMGMMPTTIDVIIIVSGILCKMGVFDFSETFVIFILSISIGETIVLQAGHAFKERVFDHFIVKKLISKKNRERIKVDLQNQKLKNLLLIRFSPALRPYFLLAMSGLGLDKKTFFQNNYILICLHVLGFMLLPYAISSVVPLNGVTVVAILGAVFLFTYLIGQKRKQEIS